MNRRRLGRTLVALFAVAAAPTLATAGQTNNILITGYWPPTNEMLRAFSRDPAQNPGTWVGENWEGRGFNVHAHFPEFPGGTGVNPWGNGDFEVDYQDTAADWLRITEALKPVAIITFSRASTQREWQLEPAYQRFRNPGEANPPGRTIPQYVSDGRDTLYPTNVPMTAEPVGRVRHSTLPMQRIVDDVKAAYPLLTDIDPHIAAYNPATPDTFDYGGAYLSGYIGYHGAWYHDQNAAPDAPFRNFAAGHIHVGRNLNLAIAEASAKISIRALIDHIAPMLPRAGDANIDGTVNIADFAALAANFNTPVGAVWEDGDFTYDNAVTIADFSLLAANFNTTAARGPAAVPEPIAVAPAAVAALLRRRRSPAHLPSARPVG